MMLVNVLRGVTVGAGALLVGELLLVAGTVDLVTVAGLLVVEDDAVGAVLPDVT